MEREKIVKIIYWVLFACALGSLWISLRSQLYAMEYSLIAVAFWVAAYFFNKKFMTKEE
ncbi:hypothetical protein AAOP42_16065 [Reichenbachiella sp. MALMAid0571]